jgi:hypothetical protein
VDHDQGDHAGHRRPHHDVLLAGGLGVGADQGGDIEDGGDSANANESEEAS